MFNSMPYLPSSMALLFSLSIHSFSFSFLALVVFALELCLLSVAPHIRDAAFVEHYHSLLLSFFEQSILVSLLLESIWFGRHRSTRNNKTYFIRAHPEPCAPSGLTSICAFLAQFSPIWAAFLAKCPQIRLKKIIGHTYNKMPFLL